jgi:hypothetical protein
MLLDAYSRVTVGVSEKVCPSVVSVEVMRLSRERGGGAGTGRASPSGRTGTS